MSEKERDSRQALGGLIESMEKISAAVESSSLHRAIRDRDYEWLREIVQNDEVC